MGFLTILPATKQLSRMSAAVIQPIAFPSKNST